MLPRLLPIIEAHVVVTRRTDVEAAHHGVLRGVESGSIPHAPVAIGVRELWANDSLSTLLVSPSPHEHPHYFTARGGEERSYCSSAVPLM